MTPSIRARLEALEHLGKPTGELPTILPDDAPDSEIERLRAQGLEVYRFSDGVVVDVNYPDRWATTIVGLFV